MVAKMCLGGGQLGRMLASAASLLNVPVVILDVGVDAPAKQVLQPLSPNLEHVDGSFSDPTKIKELAGKAGVLTVEIEHVDATALEQIEKEFSSSGKKLDIQPSPRTIRIIQDKYDQKKHLLQHGCPVSEFLSIDPLLPKTSVEDAANRLGLPLMLKSRTLAYDGRGNSALCTIEAHHQPLEVGVGPLYASNWTPLVKGVAATPIRLPRHRRTMSFTWYWYR